MKPGVVEVFAYQETLLMMAVFGTAILGMIWVGFRRWLQHKDRVGRLIAEQTAQNGANMKRVEARLEAIEHVMTDRAVPLEARIEASPTDQLSDPTPKHEA